MSSTVYDELTNTRNELDTFLAQGSLELDAYEDGQDSLYGRGSSALFASSTHETVGLPIEDYGLHIDNGY